MAPPPRWTEVREHLGSIHRAALAAADPGDAVRRHLRMEHDELVMGAHRLPLGPRSRVRLIALGKAAGAMSHAALARLGARVDAGVVAHPRNLVVDRVATAGIRYIEGGHPEPDRGSLEAGLAVESAVAGLSSDDLVLVLVSGGGSAICELVREGVGLETLRELTRALQHAGAEIHELNTVRRALSRLKGGGLARLASPARVAALLLSDVIGDDPAAIASGPVTPSPTGPDEARGVLDRYGLAARFAEVNAMLRSGDPPAPATPAALTIVVGSNRMAAQAAASASERLGFRAVVLTDRLHGEAREVGRVTGAIARSAREAGLPLPAPACLVLGGETTVSVRGAGRGGRNHEMALGAALALQGCSRVAVFCFATDGMDGSSGAAGAIATGDTIARARAAGLDPDRALAASDTGAFFDALGDAVVTGPSGTNVNDVAVALVYP